jgi:hypothetical protein
MGEITTIGLDLAKNVFQVHAVDKAGKVVVRKRLRRGQVLTFFAGIAPCLVGLSTPLQRCISLAIHIRRRLHPACA